MCTLGLLRRGPACCLVPTLFSVCARAAEASDESRTDCNVLSGVGRDALQQVRWFIPHGPKFFLSFFLHLLIWLGIDIRVWDRVTSYSWIDFDLFDRWSWEFYNKKKIEWSLSELGCMKQTTCCKLVSAHSSTVRPKKTSAVRGSLVRSNAKV